MCRVTSQACTRTSCLSCSNSPLLHITLMTGHITTWGVAWQQHVPVHQPYVHWWCVCVWVRACTRQWGSACILVMLFPCCVSWTGGYQTDTIVYPHEGLGNNSLSHTPVCLEGLETIVYPHISASWRPARTKNLEWVWQGMGWVRRFHIEGYLLQGWCQPYVESRRL